MYIQKPLLKILLQPIDPTIAPPNLDLCFFLVLFLPIQQRKTLSFCMYILVLNWWNIHSVSTKAYNLKWKTNGSIWNFYTSTYQKMKYLSKFTKENDFPRKTHTNDGIYIRSIYQDFYTYLVCRKLVLQ